MEISFNSDMASLANPKVRRQKFGIVTFIFLMLFGAAFTSVGLFAIKSTKIDPSWTRVQGKVVSSSSSINNGSTTYTPVVQYQVDGKTYQVTGDSSSSFYPTIGSFKQVAYNPSQPQEAKVVSGGGTKAMLYIFPAIGIVCLVLSPVLFIRSLRRGHDIRGLMQTGQKLQGVITDIQTYGAAGTTNNTYKIVVSAVDLSGATRNFISDSLMGIGGLAMADFRNQPIPIDVYVDTGNPNNYYVDVSEVPSLTPERITELIRSATGHQANNFAQGEQPNSSPLQTSPQVISPQVAEQPVQGQPPQPPAGQPTTTNG